MDGHSYRSKLSTKCADCRDTTSIPAPDLTRFQTSHNMSVFEGAFAQWAYLVAYNAVSALLWLSLLVQTALASFTDGLHHTYAAVRALLIFTQTLAALEIFHAATGLIHAPVLTTIVQVAGRSTVLWLVVENYPSAAWTPFYTFMVLAWSAADAIRYLYFATRLVGGHQYPTLTWLRYSAFYVLYPIGIAGELGVVYHAVSEAFKLGFNAHAWGYIAAATIYIPGQSF